MQALAFDISSADDDQQQRLHVLEALLFAAPKPLSLQQLAEHFGVTADEVSPWLATLQQQYAQRGVRVVERPLGWTFETAPELASALNLVREKPAKLSRAALETLAIIAYHQPVTRAEIEAIRGVAISKGTLDILLETGWIKPGHRKDIPGRPLTWLCTPLFLDHFGLTNLKELPGLADLKAAGLLDRQPALPLLPDTEASDSGDSITAEPSNDEETS